MNTKTTKEEEFKILNKLKEDKHKALHKYLKTLGYLSIISIDNTLIKAESSMRKIMVLIQKSDLLIDGYLPSPTEEEISIVKSFTKSFDNRESWIANVKIDDSGNSKIKWIRIDEN